MFAALFWLFSAQTLKPIYIRVVHVLQVHLPKEETVKLLHYGVFPSLFLEFYSALILLASYSCTYHMELANNIIFVC